MADVERIVPPVPTLPAPVGRRVDTHRRQRSRPPPRARQDEQPRAPTDQRPEHIDEYV
jgi:hypothetical protein